MCHQRSSGSSDVADDLSKGEHADGKEYGSKHRAMESRRMRLLVIMMMMKMMLLQVMEVMVVPPSPRW